MGGLHYLREENSFVWARAGYPADFPGNRTVRDVGLYYEDSAKLIRELDQFLGQLARLPGGNLVRFESTKEEVENMIIGLHRWELRKRQLGADTTQWRAERTAIMHGAVTGSNGDEDFSSAEILRDIRHLITGKCKIFPKEKTPLYFSNFIA